MEEVTQEEVLNVIRQRFPLQFEIAVQAVQIAKLSQQVNEVSDGD